MRGFKTSSRENASRKNKSGSRRSKLSWPLLPIQSLRTRRNRSEQRIKKWLGTSTASCESKNKKKTGEKG